MGGVVSDNKLMVDIKLSNILIVDDEAANIKLIKKLLALKGFTNVISTQDSTQALSLYQENNSDLILLDLNMPKLDGHGVIDQFNDLVETDCPPILVLTANHDQSNRLSALDKGARDYVTKPFDFDELISRVRNLLEVQIAKKYMKNQNEILERKVLERTHELHETRLQVVRHLGRAAEYRDNETGLHIIRMSKIAALLGKASGMSEYHSDLLLNASPMHDIGKIGIPDRILLKPGKLDFDEFEVMKTHASVGAEILSKDDSDLMVMAHEIALTHHEKFNGQGYPNSLKGEAIPFVGRITALADVFDALTSVRPYKKAWTVEDAVNLIVKESGEHFDPKLVEIFLVNLAEIIIIKEKYSDVSG